MGEHVSSLVAQSGGGSSLLGMLPFLVGMFVIMYFLMIRPERKRQTEHQNLLSSLKKGDEVVLTSGIVAKILSVDDKTLMVEIADKVRVKVLKQAVSGPSARYLGAPADAKQVEATSDDEKKKAEKAEEKKASA